MKKVWLKKWQILLNKDLVDVEIGTIINYCDWGKTEIKNEENINEWVLPWEPMTIVQACREYWITPQKYYYHISRFPELKRKHDELRLGRLEYVNSMAENNIEKAIRGEGSSLTEKERVDFSFRMLEKTDKLYNPKTEIEQKTISINLSQSSEDIINSLKKILWVSTQSNEIIENDD